MRETLLVCEARAVYARDIDSPSSNFSFIIE